MHSMHWAMLWSILEIRRLGHGCENLPQGVRLSPAQLDSSITKEASIKAESLGDMSEAEARMADQWRSGICNQKDMLMKVSLGCFSFIICQIQSPWHIFT